MPPSCGSITPSWSALDSRGFPRHGIADETAQHDCAPIEPLPQTILGRGDIFPRPGDRRRLGGRDPDRAAMTRMSGEQRDVGPSPTPAGFTVMALIAAFNEADIIGQVIRHLIDQGVRVYLLDHASTDGTVAEAQPYLGRGLVRIERFTEREPGGNGRVSWTSILRRKEALARELDASWFIHHDADEFRESPWAHLSLRDAIGFVDRLGYNAIDFELFNFWPTHDGFTGREDVRDTFRYYTPPAACDRLQIKAWKNVTGPVDLAASGGHEAIFPGRRVFPIRFLLRHYPIRSQSHGTRKVLYERKARFSEEEQRRGWHVQYDAVDENYDFIRDARGLTEYDPDAARLHVILHHRGVEVLEQTPTLRDETISDLRRNIDTLNRQFDTRNRETGELQGELDARNRTVDELSRQADQRNREAEELHRQLDQRSHEAVELGRQLDGRNRDAEKLAHELDRRAGEADELRQAQDASRREIAELRGELDARNRTHAELSHQAEQLNREVEELHRQVDQRSHEVAELGRQLDGRNRDAEKLAHELDQRIGEADELRRELDTVRRESQRLASELTAAQQRLSDLHASLSWRCTAPLRAIGRALVRGKRARERGV